MIDCITLSGFHAPFFFNSRLAQTPVLRGSDAKFYSNTVSHLSRMGQTHTILSSRILHLIALSTKPNPHGPGIDATSRPCSLESFLTAHDLATTTARRLYNRGGGPLGPFMPIALALAPAPWKLAPSMFRIGYVHVWAFAGAISRPTFV